MCNSEAEQLPIIEREIDGKDIRLKRLLTPYSDILVFLSLPTALKMSISTNFSAGDATDKLQY